MKAIFKTGMAISLLGFALFTINPANGSYQNQGFTQSIKNGSGYQGQ